MGNGSFRENVRRSTETKIDAVTNVTNKGTTKTQKQKMPRPRGMKKRKRRIAAHLLRERLDGEKATPAGMASQG